MSIVGNFFAITKVKLGLSSRKPLVGVYGVTSVGKSTFLNVLLNSDEFESSMGETTKKVHVIQHTKDKREVEFPNTTLETEYVKKQFSILKNFSIVDIPGTSKSFSTDDIAAVTEELDVVIWMFDIQGDISPADTEFLNKILLKNMIKVVVVLNKIDSGMGDIDFDDADEKNEFVSEIAGRIETIYSFFENNSAEGLLVEVIPVSARKLFKNILVKKDKNLLKHRKNIVQTLIATAKSSLNQKRTFRDPYEKWKLACSDELSLAKIHILKSVEEELTETLSLIEDEDIVSGNIDIISVQSLMAECIDSIDSISIHDKKLGKL